MPEQRLTNPFTARIDAVGDTLAFSAHMLGARRLFAAAAERCLPD
jgi:hypothetical protein